MYIVAGEKVNPVPIPPLDRSTVDQSLFSLLSFKTFLSILQLSIEYVITTNQMLLRLLDMLH